MKEREQISAGGVAFRQRGDRADIALVLTLPGMRWQLPKGIIDPGETAEEASLREVSEEAGIKCELLCPLGTINYQFVDGRRGEAVRINKTVHFFLMRYISGNVADHDNEVADAKWFESSSAAGQLFFESERNILLEAITRITKL